MMLLFGIRKFLEAFCEEAKDAMGIDVWFPSLSATEICKEAQDFHRRFMSGGNSLLFSDCADIDGYKEVSVPFGLIGFARECCCVTFVLHVQDLGSNLCVE